MSDTAITIDPETGEIIDEPTAIEVHQVANLFGANSPEQVVKRAVSVANELKLVLQGQGLIKNISGKQYPLVEAWTLLGSMLGVFPVVVWTKETANGWEARVEARTINGDVVGAAEASCTRDEQRWRTAEDYAIRAMAQTRATSRALRGPLGFVMSLAGYEPTAMEEIPDRQEWPVTPVGGGSTAAPAPSKPVVVGGGEPATGADQPSTSAGPPPSMLSEQQMKNLHATGTRKGFTHEQLHEMAGRDFSAESMKELTKRDANEMLKLLNEYPDVAEA